MTLNDRYASLQTTKIWTTINPHYQRQWVLLRVAHSAKRGIVTVSKVEVPSHRGWTSSKFITRIISLEFFSLVGDITSVIETWKPSVARKARNAAPVIFSLKFADNTHYKFKSRQASKAMLQSYKHTGTKQNLTQNGHSWHQSVERRWGTK